MTRLLGCLQLVCVTLQGAPEVVKLVPEKYHPLLHFSVSLFQGLAWYLQRSYNPDGTMAEAPYDRRAIRIPITVTEKEPTK